MILCYATFLGGLGLRRKMRQLAKTLQEASAATAQLARDLEEDTSEIILTLRPWITVSAVRTGQADHAVAILLVNRGMTPAVIMETTNRIGILSDGSSLAPLPDFTPSRARRGATFRLFPGQSEPLQQFDRDDLNWLCKDIDQSARVLHGEELVVMYGRSCYQSETISSAFETRWCFRWDPSEPRPELIPFGSDAYNEST